MKSLYSDVPEVPDSEYLFEDGRLTVVCKDGVAKITLSEHTSPISLLEIVQRYPEVEILIHEAPLSGEVFRYEHYNTYEWLLVGKTRGYA